MWDHQTADRIELDLRLHAGIAMGMLGIQYDVFALIAMEPGPELR